MAKGIRQTMGQKFLAYAVNHGLERGMFTLVPGPVSCPESGFEFSISGIPGVGHFSEVGYDEIRVKAILWPTDYGAKTIYSAHFEGFKKLGGFVTYGWFERRDGNWIMDKAEVHCSKARHFDVLEIVMPKLTSFSTFGKFII